MEFDRDGKRYDQRLKAEPQLAQSLDGDYFKSQWDKTGVVEADCIICHLPGYNAKERSKQLIFQNYKWATVAASGIGEVKGLSEMARRPAWRTTSVSSTTTARSPWTSPIRRRRKLHCLPCHVRRQEAGLFLERPDQPRCP